MTNRKRKQRGTGAPPPPVDQRIAGNPRTGLISIDIAEPLTGGEARQAAWALTISALEAEGTLTPEESKRLRALPPDLLRKSVDLNTFLMGS